MRNERCFLLLENRKALLTYGLSEEEIKKISSNGSKVIIIQEDMAEMKIKDILTGFKFAISDKVLPKEKVILFNSYNDKDIKSSITYIKKTIPDAIMAVVTNTSSQWTFSYLLDHLIEEREWYKSQQKG